MRKIFVTLYFWLLISLTNIFAASLVAIEIIIFSSYDQRYMRSIVENVIAKNCIYMMTLLDIWTVEYIDNRTKFRTRKDSNPYKTKPNYIIVCNHLSIIDTIFTSQLPFDKIYTWKKKWVYTPIFGQLCYLGGHITIDTNDIVSRQNSIQKSCEYLNAGLSVLFYPEGTRNKIPNTLLPFKNGAFRVAKQTNVKILPVTIIGTDQGCNGFICDIATIKIIIDDPIDIIDMDIDTAITKVREIMTNNFK